MMREKAQEFEFSEFRHYYFNCKGEKQKLKTQVFDKFIYAALFAFIIIATLCGPHKPQITNKPENNQTNLINHTYFDYWAV